MDNLELTFSRLQAGGEYAFAGQRVLADSEGNAVVTIHLDKPLDARLEPVSTR